jgi:nuclear transport factor 2 (NTF2) superfamily protein
MDNKSLLPPFTQETATLEVRPTGDTSRRHFVQGLAGGALAIGGARLANSFSSSKGSTMDNKPPLPPFTQETATQKVRGAEDAWNSRDPDRVSLVYTEDTRWRNRAEFPVGREQVRQFLQRKWAKELDYRLIKELWAFGGDRIAVRFAYEWHDDSGQWFRSYGNENWEFNEQGFMMRRYASINDLPIKASDRKFFWPLGRRPDDHPGLSDSGL